MSKQRGNQAGTLAVVCVGCRPEWCEEIHDALIEKNGLAQVVQFQPVECENLALRQWRAGWFDAALLAGAPPPEGVEAWVRSAYQRPVLAVHRAAPSPAEAQRYGAIGAALVGDEHPGQVAAALAGALGRAALYRNFADRLAELEAVNRDLRSFAHMLSHELRQPLHVALGFLDIVALEAADRLHPGEIDALDAAQAAVVRAGSILDAVCRTLDGDDDAPARAVPVRVDRLLERIAARMRPELAEAGAQLSWGALVDVRADPQMLEQLFENLIRNAIVHCRDESPRIAVMAQRVGRGVEFVVADNGSGIPRDELQRIFEPRWRGSGAQSRPGSGLGLALCRRIVEYHGGEIWVESTPGQGSCFHFVLSAADD